jgi:hypothetical protein
MSSIFPEYFITSPNTIKHFFLGGMRHYKTLGTCNSDTKIPPYTNRNYMIVPQNLTHTQEKTAMELYLKLLVLKTTTLTQTTYK